MINSLSNFVYQSTKVDYSMEEWAELNFLIYKKFYFERMKVLKVLKKHPIMHPFILRRATI